MGIGGPIIEIADNGYCGGIGRPDGKIITFGSKDSGPVGAEQLVNAVMRALLKISDIFFGKEGIVPNRFGRVDEMDVFVFFFDRLLHGNCFMEFELFCIPEVWKATSTPVFLSLT